MPKNREPDVTQKYSAKTYRTSRNGHNLLKKKCDKNKSIQNIIPPSDFIN